MAVDVSSAEAVERIRRLQADLALTGADLKMVDIHNLHFTIKFFGEISEAAAEEIARRLGNVEFKSIDVTYHRLGVFPSLGRISVVWVGTDAHGGEALSSMASRVEEQLAGLLHGGRDRFHPHLTIARVRSGRGKEHLVQFIRRNEDVAVGDDHLTALKLKKSELTPRGPIYTDLRVFPFSEG